MFGPLIVVLLLLPRRWLRSRWVAGLLLVFSFTPLALGVLTFIGEITFFNEFQARFNFIAVDYLVYTHEVIRNVWESYPVGWAIAGLVVVLVPAMIALFKWIRSLEYRSGWQRGPLVGLLAITMIMAATADEEKWLSTEPYWAREVGKNTLYALFHAYRHNSIDFHDFYSTVNSQEAEKLTLEWLRSPSLTRQISASPSPKKWNVVMVIIESMSARFLQHYGNQKPLTPNLDRFADSGLFFSKLYSTGTRTVRGLEALMLSLPPTPGQSILRRPNSDGIFNIGTVFREKGYTTQFIYGGYALFDNMKEWYSGNGFEVHDRATFDSNEIHFANAWGVCDEDLFDQVIKQADALHAKNQPFFQAVLTTSNHRPYTYPDGRIDIPSFTGREGAVKYTDYAIGRFVKMSENKPWFKNTLFIFAADHNAAVAGGTDIPVADYLIPVIFYNPNLVEPRKYDRLASQIDVAPTLLGMLGFGYTSRFFGQDLNAASPAERALLGTYQKVAHLAEGKMVVLSPGFTVETQEMDGDFKVVKTDVARSRDGNQMSSDAKKTISIYQTASEYFATGRAKVAQPPD